MAGWKWENWTLYNKFKYKNYNKLKNNNNKSDNQ